VASGLPEWSDAETGTFSGTAGVVHELRTPAIAKASQWKDGWIVMWGGGLLMMNPSAATLIVKEERVSN
jgi:hypothetical protein